MRNRLKWFLGGALALLLSGLALAQIANLSSNTLSGNEVWEISVGSQPGGSSFFTTVSQMRNTTGYQLQTLGAATVNTNITSNNVAKLMLAATSITTWNIGLPTAPFDGQLFEISCNGGTATTVSVAATSQTIAGTAYTTCGNGGAASQTAEWLFSLANTTWNRIQ